MKKRTLLAVLSAVLAAACRHSLPQESALEGALASALHGPPCGQIIPMSWTPSFPIPTAAGSGGEFSIFFYAVADRQGDEWLGTPSGRAVIKIGSAQAQSCERGRGSRHSLRRDQALSKEARRLGAQALEDERARLYFLLQQAGALYDARSPLSPEGRRHIQHFLASFSLLAEPPFLPDYYRLNPDFWTWIKGQGLSLPDGLSPPPQGSLRNN